MHQRHSVSKPPRLVLRLASCRLDKCECATPRNRIPKHNRLLARRGTYYCRTQTTQTRTARVSTTKHLARVPVAVASYVFVRHAARVVSALGHRLCFFTWLLFLPAPGRCLCARRAHTPGFRAAPLLPASEVWSIGMLNYSIAPRPFSDPGREYVRFSHQIHRNWRRAGGAWRSALELYFYGRSRRSTFASSKNSFTGAAHPEAEEYPA